MSLETTTKNNMIEELCSIYYTPNKMEHAQRVAKHSVELAHVFGYKSDDNDFFYQLGLIHDLYESTRIKRGIWFQPTMESNLILLTKEKGVPYTEYIDNLKNEAFTYSACRPAYIVKLADIWDHVTNAEAPLPATKKYRYLDTLMRLL